MESLLGAAGEEPYRTLDGDATTKFVDLNWQVGGGKFIVNFGTNNPQAVYSYQFVTPNDFQVRDLVSWQVAYSDDGTTLTTIGATVTGAVWPTERGAVTIKYMISV